MQFLTLTHHNTHGFIYITDRPNPDPWEPYLNNGTTGDGGRTTPAKTGTVPLPQTRPLTAPANNQQKQQGQSQEVQNHSPPSRTMLTAETSSFAAWYSMTLHTCEPLWCHRLTLTVPSGLVFEVSDFRVRIGEVRQTVPVTRVRGAVVEIEYCGPLSSSSYAASSESDHAMQTPEELARLAEKVSTNEFLTAPEILTQASSSSPFPATPATTAAQPSQYEDDIQAVASDEDWATGEVLIREFWERFAVEGAKEAIRVPDVGKESREFLSMSENERKKALKARNGKNGADLLAGVDLARQYMELFRFNR